MSLDVYLSATIDLGGSEPFVAELYSTNVTHNLTRMASAFGLYEIVWRPDECGITEAWQLIDKLTDGLEELQNRADEARTYNPPNGWGDYDGFVRFLSGYLDACRKWPKASVSVSR